ncbi:MAG: MATE family efflux transporter [Lachnospiraceae bacterium]|nr:MATE family efflux transporter [Lachnospiraceae bacterium]
MDMLHGKLAGKLILFALPIATSSVFQQLFNAADTAVVGKFADANALAAVGTNGEIVALLVSLSVGLAVGANVLLARLIGAGQQKKMKDAVSTAMVLALVFGILGGIAGQWVACPLLELIHTPNEIMDLALLYLKLYFVGYPALLVYDFGAAILRAGGDSKRPFIILLLSGAVNVLLNLFFVIVCHMGVAGVALATDIANVIAMLMIIALLLRKGTPYQLDLHHLTVRWKLIGKLLQIGIPTAIQGAVFCFANIFVQAAVNGFGATVIAGSSIAMNYEYFGYYVITAFGQAATTFVSQNYAAGNRKRCWKVMWICIGFSVLFSGLVTVPLTVFRFGVSGLFSPDANVVREAALRVIYILTFEPICGMYEVPAGYLRGIGYSTAPAVVTILGTCVLRIVWTQTYFPAVGTLRSLYMVFPVSWVADTVLMWVVFLVLCRKRSGEKYSLRNIAK